MLGMSNRRGKKIFVSTLVLVYQLVKKGVRKEERGKIGKIRKNR